MSAPTKDEIIAHFREQAGFCAALGSPFMEALCLAMANDISESGPVAGLVDGWPGNPRRDALSLRIAGYLHYCVLSGAAPQLASVYPATNPNWTMQQVWPVARAFLEANAQDAAGFMAAPPQTNETRRAIALLPGFLKTASLYPGPMHLLELGASAGLNQNWDRFTYKTSRWELTGDPSIEIDTDWSGPPPDHLDMTFNIVSRAACDQSPIDVNEPDASLRLASYIWPDQPERLKRLDAAMELARRTRIQIDKADAVEWLAAKLAARPEEGVTVVYHSVFLQYPPAEVRRALLDMLEEEGAAATFERPLAWLCFEPGAFFQGPDQVGINPNDFVTYLRVWPDNETFRLARSDGHAIKVERL